MTSYTVTAVDKVEDKPAEGEFRAQKVIYFKLQEYGQEPKVARWYTVPNREVPAVGSKIEGELEQKPYGWSFKKASAGGGGGGGWRPEPPEVRRSIAMQSSQKVAVSVLELAAAHGDYKPPSAGDVVHHVEAIAASLFAQVQKAEAGP